MKLIIPNITQKEARKIVEHFYGVLMWRKTKNGFVAYPVNTVPVEIIEDSPNETVEPTDKGTV